MRSQPSRGSRNSGFTLIELLVVVGIIGIIASLSLVAVQSARAYNKRLACANQLRQIGIGLHAHQAVHGIFPPQSKPLGGSRGTGHSNQGIGWHTYVLPFIEQEPLWRKTVEAYEKDPHPLSPPHREAAQTVVPLYVCPEDGRLSSPRTDPQGTTAAFTTYVGMTGSLWAIGGGIFGRSVGVSPAQITDGLSTTIMVGERPPPGSFSIGWWYTTHAGPRLTAVNDHEMRSENPTDFLTPGCYGEIVNWPGEGSIGNLYSFTPGSTRDECDRYHYWSLHPGGANFLFADGSVRFLPYAARFVLRFHATIAQGEPPTGW
ncbi:MAG: DUF1559 domain-containing protein [Isosphaeraceae bacterium]|nr:DUF1559 domain-containing protein [Isosphaeraceae bacterium]